MAAAASATPSFRDVLVDELFLLYKYVEQNTRLAPSLQVDDLKELLAVCREFGRASMVPRIVYLVNQRGGRGAPLPEFRERATLDAATHRLMIHTCARCGLADAALKCLANAEQEHAHFFASLDPSVLIPLVSALSLTKRVVQLQELCTHIASKTAVLDPLLARQIMLAGVEHSDVIVLCSLFTWGGLEPPLHAHGQPHGGARSSSEARASMTSPSSMSSSSPSASSSVIHDEYDLLLTGHAEEEANMAGVGSASDMGALRNDDRDDDADNVEDADHVDGPFAEHRSVAGVVDRGDPLGDDVLASIVGSDDLVDPLEADHASSTAAAAERAAVLNLTLGDLRAMMNVAATQGSAELAQCLRYYSALRQFPDSECLRVGTCYALARSGPMHTEDLLQSIADLSLSSSSLSSSPSTAPPLPARPLPYQLLSDLAVESTTAPKHASYIAHRVRSLLALHSTPVMDLVSFALLCLGEAAPYGNAPPHHATGLFTMVTEELGLAPDASLFNSMIYVLLMGKLGQTGNMLATVESMDQQGVHPTPHTLDYMVRDLTINGLHANLMEIVEFGKLKQVQFLKGTYMVAARELYAQGMFDDGDLVLEQMQKVGGYSRPFYFDQRLSQFRRSAAAAAAAAATASTSAPPPSS